MKNNPFNMRWPWIGLIIGPILIYILFKMTYHGCTGIWCFPGLAEKGAVAVAIMAAVVGFLVGWLIQTKVLGAQR